MSDQPSPNGFRTFLIVLATQSISILRSPLLTLVPWLIGYLADWLIVQEAP